MKNIKSFAQFVNEDLEELKQDIETNLGTQEAENQEAVDDIKKNFDTQVQNIKKKKELINTKMELLKSEILNITDKKQVDQAKINLEKLKADLASLDNQVKILTDQKTKSEKEIK